MIEWKRIETTERDGRLVLFCDNTEPYKSGMFLGQILAEGPWHGWDINKGVWRKATHLAEVEPPE